MDSRGAAAGYRLRNARLKRFAYCHEALENKVALNRADPLQIVVSGDSARDRGDDIRAFCKISRDVKKSKPVVGVHSERAATFDIVFAGIEYHLGVAAADRHILTLLIQHQRRLELGRAAGGFVFDYRVISLYVGIV